MASVVAPGSQPTPSLGPQQHATTHSKKRAADGPLENEQRLSKRFDLLNLENSNSRLYIPVPGSFDTPTAHHPQDPVTTPHPLAATIPLQKSAPQRTPRAPRSDDGMQVEDTPHRVYISDLAAEISDIESDEENPIFLPDIEKHLSKIPRHVLLGGSGSQEPKASENNQVVLYNVPASLTLPAEQDGVRKAIVEARQRIREKQASAVREPERVLGSVGESSGAGYGGIPQMEDSDAMDID